MTSYTHLRTPTAGHRNRYTALPFRWWNQHRITGTPTRIF